MLCHSFVLEEDLYELPFDNLLIINDKDKNPSKGAKYLNWDHFPGELGVYKSILDSFSDMLNPSSP